MARRKVFEKTEEFRDKYRYRAGIEATISYYEKKTAASLKATGVNILRAATFKNGKNRDNGPTLSSLRPVLELYNIVKELLSSIMDDLRRMIRQSYICNQLPAKYTP